MLSHVWPAEWHPSTQASVHTTHEDWPAIMTITHRYLCLVSAGQGLVSPHRQGTGHVVGFTVLGANQTKGGWDGVKWSTCELKEQQ